MRRHPAPWERPGSRWFNDREGYNAHMAEYMRDRRAGGPPGRPGKWSENALTERYSERKARRNAPPDNR